MRSYLRHASRENTSYPVDQSLTRSICGHQLITWLTFQRVSANRTVTVTAIDAGLEHLRRCRSKHYDANLMVEIARQFATASCLLQFSMTSDMQFLTCNIEMEKHEEVVAGELLTAECTSLVRNFRPDNQPDYLSATIEFAQLGKPVCSVRFTLVSQAEMAVPRAETSALQAKREIPQAEFSPQQTQSSTGRAARLQTQSHRPLLERLRSAATLTLQQA